MKLTPQQQQELDQFTAQYVDIVTASIKRLYDGLLAEGFSKSEALCIVSKTASDLFVKFMGVKHDV